MRCGSSGLFLSFLLLGAYPPDAGAWAQPLPKPSASPAPSAPAPSSTASKEQKAEELFRKGKALYAQGKLDEAYSAYKEALALHKRYDIAGNLGNVAFTLGKMRDAAEYLTYSITNLPATASADARTMLEERLSKARESIGTLSIMIREKDCQVIVDGELLLSERTPEGKVEVFVEAGLHMIEVKRAGFKPTRKEVRTDIGSRQEVELEVPSVSFNMTPMRPAVRPSHSDVLHVAQPQQDSGGMKRWKPWAIVGGAGLAAAGIGVGVGFTVAANGKSDSAATELDERIKLTAAGVKICGPGSPPENAASCTHIKEELRKQDTFERAAAAGYVIGGVLAAGTAVLLLWRPTDQPRPQTSIQVVPLVAPSYGGFVAIGSF